MKNKSTIPETLFFDSDDNMFFDVDETLVFWKTDFDPNDDIIEAVDPYLGGQIIKLVPHHRHVNFLKRAKGQGRQVVVWSAGGAYWAKAVVEALGIEDYVDVIMSKPVAYCDDTPLIVTGKLV